MWRTLPRLQLDYQQLVCKLAERFSAHSLMTCLSRPAALLLASLFTAASFAAELSIAEFTPSGGPPGDQVTVKGDGLQAVSRVLINGVPASFTVLSSTCLTAIVPPVEAMSGPITVTAGETTAASPAPFRIEPPYSTELESPDQVPRPPIPFMSFVRPDGRTVTYYAAGDRYLEQAFALLDRYWSPLPGLDPAAVRTHSKYYLPLELRKLGHEPAELLMRHYTDSFFRLRNTDTGLLAYSTSSWIKYPRRTGQLRPYLAYQIPVYFRKWFPDDRQLVWRTAELAEGILKYGDRCGGGAECGMYSSIDVTTAKPVTEVSRVHEYGHTGIMMADISVATGDPRFAAWAARKQDFIWSQRLAPPLPLMADAYGPNATPMEDAEPDTSDTDTLYNARRLFEMYALTGNETFRERAMALADYWYEHAWKPEWGHFVRKLGLDGKPAADFLYGDSKYNTLWVLIHAYRVTGEQRYLERVREAFTNLRMMGEDGLLPLYVSQGEMDKQRGLSKNQPMFLQILLEAYSASSDSRFLCDAEQLADSILAHPERALHYPSVRAFAGDALLRLAMARTPVHRMDVVLPSPRTRLKITTESGATLLETVVMGDVAAVYAPQGTYVVEAGQGRQKRVQTVALTTSVTLTAECRGNVLCISRGRGYAGLNSSKEAIDPQ
jgi:hypothetical protein